MLKKMITSLVTATMFFSVFAVPVQAANVETNFILGINLVLVDGDDLIFEPSKGEALFVNETLNTGSFEAQLQNASGYVKVMKDGDTVRTLAEWSGEDLSGEVEIPEWNGAEIDATAEAEAICGNQGSECPAGVYSVEIHIEHDAGGDIILYDTDSVEFSIGSVSTLEIVTFNVSNTGGGNFDPSPKGDDENLLIDYSLSGEPVQVQALIRNDEDDVLKILTSTDQTDTLVWDGEHAGDIVAPGTYSVRLVVEDSMGINVEETENFEVFYSSSNRPEISNFSVSPDKFDPDNEVAVIEFDNEEDAELTVQIQDSDGDPVYTYDEYNGDDYGDDTSHDISWDGRYASGTKVPVKTYTVFVEAINDYGVDVKEDTVQVYNDGTASVDSSNSHIGDISFSPRRFEPAVDDYVTIEFDAKVDLDELEVLAIRGGTEIELYDDDNIDEENNIEFEWDGEDDDGDYVAEGTWRIEFHSEVNGVDKVAVKDLVVEYDKPRIDDLFVSKSKFDPDEDETTYIVFKLDADALVDIDVLEDGDEDEEIEEDYEVEANRWYAVEWDGDNYDEEDDLDIRLTAKNIANEDIIETEKTSVDLSGDFTGSRTNITRDFIDPVAASTSEEINLYYDLDGDAEVTISIHKGETGTGTTQIVLFEDYEHTEGGYGIIWDGRDEDGDKLTGKYSYKIVAKSDSGTDTEKGAFVIGSVGEVEGSGGSSISSNSSTSSTSGKKASNVIVDGVSFNSGSSSNGGCADFNDVSTNHENCTAIQWAKNAGIVQGFGDNTFRPDASITRMELLKIVLEGLGIDSPAGNYGTLGFKDVSSNDWFVAHLKRAQDLGVITGDEGKNTVRPNDNINRAEAVKILFETVSVQSNAYLQTCSSTYSDTPNNAWYNKYVCASKNLNLLDPLYSNNFGPGVDITRGEVTEMLYRLAQL